MEDELMHHGIKGQKWGVRRYQNEDGSLTSQGKQRYDDGSRFDENGNYKRSDKWYNKGVPIDKKVRIREGLIGLGMSEVGRIVGSLGAKAISDLVYLDDKQTKYVELGSQLLGSIGGGAIGAYINRNKEKKDYANYIANKKG